MKLLLAVFAGGGIGALLRHGAISAQTRLLGPDIPYATLFVNVLGSFLIGLLIEAAALKWQMSLEMRAFIATGVLGGFTTFSAFSVEIFRLAETGHATQAAIYALTSVILCVLAVFAGVFLLRGVLA